MPNAFRSRLALFADGFRTGNPLLLDRVVRTGGRALGVPAR